MCGLTEDDPNTPYDESEDCELCHLFVLITNIINFLLLPVSYLNNNIPLIPAIAGLMFIIGGLYLLIAGPSPEKLRQAKSVITATVIGLLIVYIAWVFLNTFLDYIGVAEWTGLKNGGRLNAKIYFHILCPHNLTGKGPAS